MKSRGCRLLAVVVIAGLALAGCSRAITGAASADANAVPVTGKAVLGQLSTVDQCSLLDTDALDEVNVPERPSFDECSMPIGAGSGTVEMTVGPITGPGTSRAGERIAHEAKKLPRGLKLERAAEVSGEACAMYVVFGDGLGIEIEVTNSGAYGGPVRGTTELDMCAAAERGVDGVVSAISERQVRHRDYPDGSFGRLRACELIPDRLPAEVLRSQSVRELAYPSGHRCRWAATGGAAPSARFGVYTEPVGPPPGGAKREKIAGRDSFVVSAGAGPACAVRTNGDRFAEDAKLREVASVLVRLKGRAGNPCAAARKLAGAAWPALTDS